jgi:hypothetical protein
MAQMIAEGEQMISEMKQRLDPKCWKGKHKEGTKIKGGVRVNNCVPNESMMPSSSFVGSKKNKINGKGMMKATAKHARPGDLVGGS